jgi:Zn-dependent protease with chaperone function
MSDATSVYSGGPLEVLLPTLAWTAVSAYVLWGANLAIRRSPRDAPADKHFVAVAAVACVLGALVLSWALRLVVHGSGALAFLSYGWWYAHAWLGVVAIGSLAFASRLTLGTIRTRGVIAAGHPPGPETRDHFERARAALGIRSRVRVVVSPRCDSPFSTGILRPCVVLHEGFRWLNPIEQRAIVVHELAHVRRHDHATELLTQALGIVFWWNPVYWVTARWMESLREQACDQMVLMHVRDRDSYVRLLASFLGIVRRIPLNLSFATIGIADGGPMYARLARMPKRPPLPQRYDFGRLPGEVTRLQLVLIVAAFACLLATCDLITWEALAGLSEQTSWGPGDPLDTW